MIKDYSTLQSRIKKNLGDAPLISLVDQIIQDAMTLGASDLHWEPFEQQYRVRVRIDGILHILAQLPLELSPNLTSRLKIMAQLDIAERRLPQDGRFKWQGPGGKAMDIRISTCPTLFGEKIVLRLLDPCQTTLNIDALGYSPLQKQQLLDALNHSQGLILVTGPTGSGKTVSLYTALNLLNTEQRNISTVEDPIEINLPGINQVAMNAKTGLSFAMTLRAFLRQDPDVIMVGEIRDADTAEIAVKASQTGHLVLSTLHTNSALETLLRLENMGISRYNLSHSVILLVAQRLARKLCSHCKTHEILPDLFLHTHGFDLSKPLQLYKAVGCQHCHQGYKGRVGIHEVLPISESMQQLMLQPINMLDLLRQAQQEGFISLREDGLRKVADGLISLEELNRVITG